jgi:hypothetical protein
MNLEMIFIISFILFSRSNFYSISPSRNQPLGMGFFHHEPGQPLKKSGAGKNRPDNGFSTGLLRPP